VPSLTSRPASRTDDAALYRTIFELSPEGICITRIRDKTILRINRACETLFGYGRAEVLGATRGSLGIFSRLEQFDALFASLPEEGPIPPCILELARKDRRTLQIEHTGKVLKLGGERCLVAILRDSTDLRKAQEAELQARKAESLLLMAGSIAHDFNNLFAALSISMEIVAHGVQATAGAGVHPALGAALATARAALDRAIALARKMDEVSGRTRPSLEWVSLEDLLIQGAPDWEAPRGQRWPLLELGTVPKVKADPVKLHKAITEIVANAWEAMDEARLAEGQIRMKLFMNEGDEPAGLRDTWVGERPAGPATICLEIANDGPCPGPEVIARMFDPFFTTRFKGRGLGLALVLGLMQAHRAGIQILPGLDRGLAIRLHFPLPEG
jgi:PAS domain S-box-containing protein